MSNSNVYLLNLECFFALESVQWMLSQRWKNNPNSSIGWGGGVTEHFRAPYSSIAIRCSYSISVEQFHGQSSVSHSSFLLTEQIRSSYEQTSILTVSELRQKVMKFAFLSS